MNRYSLPLFYTAVVFLALPGFASAEPVLFIVGPGISANTTTNYTITHYVNATPNCGGLTASAAFTNGTVAAATFTEESCVAGKHQYSVAFPFAGSYNLSFTDTAYGPPAASKIVFYGEYALFSRRVPETNWLAVSAAALLAALAFARKRGANGF